MSRLAVSVLRSLSASENGRVLAVNLLTTLEPETTPAKRHPQPENEPWQIRGAGNGVDVEVPGSICLRERFVVFGLHRRFHVSVEISQPRDVHVRQTRRRKPRRQTLYGRADEVQLARVLRREFDDGCAAVRLVGYHAVGLERSLIASRIGVKPCPVARIALPSSVARRA